MLIIYYNLQLVKILKLDIYTLAKILVEKNCTNEKLI